MSQGANSSEVKGTSSRLQIDPGLSNWSDARLVGYKPMDDIHEEFFTVVNELLQCTVTTVAPAMAAFQAHIQSHFDVEDEWMQTTAFPPRDCHIDEHAAVKKSTNEVQQALENGSAGVELVHRFALHLLHWFPGHADHLDSALAAWLTKRAFGGKPVVFRRNIA